MDTYFDENKYHEKEENSEKNVFCVYAIEIEVYVREADNFQLLCYWYF